MMLYELKETEGNHVSLRLRLNVTTNKRGISIIIFIIYQHFNVHFSHEFLNIS
jgi:hypothetical protein